MKARHLYFVSAVAFAAYGALYFGEEDALYFLGIYAFMALSNILSALNRMTYTVVVLGFSLLLFLITRDFPPIEMWGFETKEGRDIVGLIVCCNWMGFLGVVKLYNDAYK